MSIAQDLVSFLALVKDTLAGNAEVKAVAAKAKSLAGKSDIGGIAVESTKVTNTIFDHAVAEEQETADEQYTVADATGFYRILGGSLGHSQGRTMVDLASSVASGDSVADARLNVIVDLYNALGKSSPHRHTLFRTMLSFAQRTRQLSKLKAYLDCIDQWLPDWSLEPAQVPALFLHIADEYAAAEKHSLEQDFLLRYVDAHETARESELASTTDAAARCARIAVRKPLQAQGRGLAAKRVMQRLASGEHAGLYALLQVFTTGDFAGLRALLAERPAVLSEAGVEEEEALANIRLLTLCSLAATRRVIPFADAEAALGTDADGVIRHAMMGIDKNVFEASVDELDGTITISNELQREFNPSSWDSIGERLDSWIDNVEGLLKTLDTDRERHGV